PSRNHPSSQWKQELRYSLRSLIKHGLGLRQVFVIGYLPEYIHPDGERLIHIPFEDVMGPYRNVAAKLRMLCEDDRIAEAFVWSADDIYLTRNVDLANLPVYSRGDLAN